MIAIYRTNLHLSTDFGTISRFIISASKIIRAYTFPTRAFQSVFVIPMHKIIVIHQSSSANEVLRFCISFGFNLVIIVDPLRKALHGLTVLSSSLTFSYLGRRYGVYIDFFTFLCVMQLPAARVTDANYLHADPHINFTRSALQYYDVLTLLTSPAAHLCCRRL